MTITHSRDPDRDIPGHGTGKAILTKDVFRREMRHSRMIRMLKIALPSSAAFVVAVFVAYSYLVPDGLAISIDGASLEQGRLVMSDPKLNGRTDADRPYSLTAERAIQSVEDTNVITLEAIKASLPFEDSSRASILAESGIYDRNRNMLDITGKTTVETDSGLKARFRSAMVDIASGSLSTRDPVEVEVDGAHVTADSMHIEERGKVIVFKDRVRLTLPGNKLRTAASRTGDSDDRK